MSATERLAEHAGLWMEGDYPAVLAWLAGLGCTVLAIEAERSWTVKGLTGITVGLFVGLDTIGVAVGLALAVCGAWWPQVLPGYMKLVNRQWQARRRAGGGATAMAVPRTKKAPEVHNAPVVSQAVQLALRL